MGSVPRTLIPEAHTVKREAFVDAAERLILAKGYEAMSIQDVLDDLGASRGAFYHYFDSKQALLEAVVQRLVERALAPLGAILDDPHLSAVTKLERIFAGIATFKNQQKDLMLRFIEVWTSDANAIVREKMRRLSISMLSPLLSRIVDEGVRQGLFAVESPGETAAVLLALMLGFQEQAVELFMARQDGSVSFDDVHRTIDSWTRAYERVLGAPMGSLTLADERTLHIWFG